MTNAVTSTTDITSTSNTTTLTNAAAFRSTAKRLKCTDDFLQDQSLLPGLPDHIAQLCLSFVHPSILYKVCSSWRRLIYSPSFPPFLSIYALLLSTQTACQTEDSNSLEFSSFDPISSTWHSLPPPPLHPPLRLLLRHPAFISLNIPTQSVSISGNLVLLAATTDHFLPALPRPLIFTSLTQEWAFGPPLAAPRRWCATGASGGAVYVASGIGSQYSPEVARSVEKWDLKDKHHRRNGRRDRSLEKGWKWEKMGGLRDGKFSREAIEAVGWRGKLCMVNVKGKAAKEGVVYDVENDEWVDMPEGMLCGWRGPAASMEEEAIFVVDESEGALKKYDPGTDKWVEIFQSETLRGAQHVAAAGGRVCIVCGGGVDITVVDVVARPPRFWVVKTPPGFQALAIHILPRTSQRHFS